MAIDDYASAFVESMKLFVSEAKLPPKTATQLAMLLAENSILEHSSEDHLFVFRARDGRPLSAKHFKPLTAAGVLVGIAATLLAPVSAVALGLVIVGGLIALYETAEQATYEEAGLFWVLRTVSTPANEESLRNAFQELCEQDVRVSKSGFDSALTGLIKMGCIKQNERGYSVAEVVVILGS